VYKFNSPQEAEHVILERLFPKINDGFYVDVGAHDPIRFSNTYKLYNMGWNGINVEPNKINFKRFLTYRKRDINLNVAASNKKNLIFYKFEEPALNTTSLKTINLRKTQGYSHIDKENIECLTLSNIFLKHCKNKNIDFLNIDTEGNELEILKTNNWKKFRPKVIICEILDQNINTVLKHKTSKYLISKGYIVFAKMFHNIVFLEKKFEKTINK
jgi:FkbM family methyltransferase